MTQAAPLIVLIEDEPGIAEILEAYLRHEGFRTEHATNGKVGLDYVHSLKPALVVLDIRLPGQNGVDILQAIRAECAIPVIMLTALSDDVNKLLSLRLGADDYITKPFNPAEVVARIQAVLRRSRALPAAAPTVVVGQLEIDHEMHVVMVRDANGMAQELPLTLTEFRLLAFLAKQPRRCFSRDELIESCLPESDALNRVIDSHLSKLRRKLQDAGCDNLIETVRGVGYRLWPGR